MVLVQTGRSFSHVSSNAAKCIAISGAALRGGDKVSIYSIAAINNSLVVFTKRAFLLQNVSIAEL